MSNFDWMCPFCNRHATITADNQRSGVTYLPLSNADGPRALCASFIVCPNAKCKKFTLEVSLFEITDNGRGGWINKALVRKWELIPSSKALPLPGYIPKAIVDDYNEACLIRDLSPKASATLSRRCIQGAIRDFWQVKPGRLVNEIAAIKDKVDPLTWEGIEAVRKVGNIGAHMEADINVVVDVDPQEAELLIGLIEMLLKDWYIAREARKSRLISLIQVATDKESDKKQKPPNSS